MCRENTEILFQSSNTGTQRYYKTSIECKSIPNVHNRVVRIDLSKNKQFQKIEIGRNRIDDE